MTKWCWFLGSGGGRRNLCVERCQNTKQMLLVMYVLWLWERRRDFFERKVSFWVTDIPQNLEDLPTVYVE